MKLDNYIQEEAFRISQLYREIETEILIEIATMIRNGLITPTGEYQLHQLQNISNLDINVLKAISRMSGKPLSEIKSIISEIGIRSIDFDLYRTAYERSLLIHSIDNLDIDPFIKAMQDEATGYIKGVQTVAQEQSFKEFRNAIDKSVLRVNSGLYTPQQAVAQSVRELAKQGITGATYLREGKPYKMGIEPVVYRAIRTEFIKTSNEVSHNVGIELGVEHWEITSHTGARYKVHKHEYEDHSKWQGTIVTTEELYSVCGYKQITGLGGINCAHRQYGFIKGLSVQTSFPVEEELNNKVYDLEQKQRRYENDIRKTKTEIIMLERFKDIDGFDVEIDKSKQVLKGQQKRLREYIKENDVLRRDYARERVIST